MIPFAFVGGYSLIQIAVAIVIIAAVCALVWVALRQFGISIPQWVIHCAWIVIVAIVVIVCIRFVATLF